MWVGELQENNRDLEWRKKRGNCGRPSTAAARTFRVQQRKCAHADYWTFTLSLSSVDPPDIMVFCHFTRPRKGKMTLFAAIFRQSTKLHFFHSTENALKGRAVFSAGGKMYWVIWYLLVVSLAFMSRKGGGYLFMRHRHTTGSMNNVRYPWGKWIKNVGASEAQHEKIHGALVQHELIINKNIVFIKSCGENIKTSRSVSAK